MMERFYDKAAALLRDSGGKLDSMSFGRKWRATYPDDNLESYRKSAGGTVGLLLSKSQRFKVTNRDGSPVKTFTLLRSPSGDVTRPAPKATEMSRGDSAGGDAAPDSKGSGAGAGGAGAEPGGEEKPPSPQGDAGAGGEAGWVVEGGELEDAVEERQSSRGYKFAVVSTGRSASLTREEASEEEVLDEEEEEDSDSWDSEEEVEGSALDAERAQQPQGKGGAGSPVPQGAAGQQDRGRARESGRGGREGGDGARRGGTGRASSPASPRGASKDAAAAASSRSASRSRSQKRSGSDTRGWRSPTRTPSAPPRPAGAPPAAGGAPVASGLIDTWSLVGAQSEAGEKGREQVAMDLISDAGAVTDAAPYTRLIQEHSRAAAAGDRKALDRAFKVLEEMREAGVAPTLMSYTAVISACAKSAGAGYGVFAVDRGMQALQEMQEAGVRPDIVTYNALLDSCAKAASAGDAFGVERGFRLLKMLREAKLAPNLITFNTLMHACAKSSAANNPEAMRQAAGLLETMGATDVRPDIVTYNALIDACARAGTGGLRKAIAVLDDMQHCSLTPDIVTFNSLVNACARAAGEGDTAAFSTAMQVLGKMQTSNVEANVVTFNSLMTIISKASAAGDIPDAGAALSQGTQVIGMMLTDGIAPNIITFNALVTAIVKAAVRSKEGCGEELDGVLTMMKQAEVHPNSVTFVLLMDWFVAEGKATAAAGLAAVDIMERNGVEADCGSYKSMIDGCIRSGAGVVAMMPILERMERAGCLPPVGSFNSLLGVLVKPGEGGVEAGLEIVSLMRRAEVPINSATFTILGNIRKADEAAGRQPDGTETGVTSPFVDDVVNTEAPREMEEEEEEVYVGEDHETVPWITMRPAQVGKAFDYTYPGMAQDQQDAGEEDDEEYSHMPSALTGRAGGERPRQWRQGGFQTARQPPFAADAEDGKLPPGGQGGGGGAGSQRPSDPDA